MGKFLIIGLIALSIIIILIFTSGILGNVITINEIKNLLTGWF